MLRSLYIKNFALIDALEVRFEEGLNILTGETGAGKSILIGAMQLILGARASMDLVRTGTEKATVEAIFDVPESGKVNGVLEEHGFDTSTRLIIRREIGLETSRAFVNDSPVTLQVLRMATASLVDLHGQHDHQSLLREETHLELLDSLARTEDERSAYGAAYRKLVDLRTEYANLHARRTELERNRELAAFQIEEIDQVSPQPGEEDNLQQELRLLDNAEQLVAGANEAAQALYADDDSTYDRLASVTRRLEHLVAVEPRFEPHLRDLESALTGISEVATFLRDYGADLEFDPNRTEEVRERLGAFDLLKRKYGGTVEAVLEHRANIGEDYELGESLDRTLQELATQQHTAEGDLGTAGLELSRARQAAVQPVEREVVDELARLGMPGAVFKIQLLQRADDGGWARQPDDSRLQARPDGLDECSFLISTNRGEPPKPLVRVASGGEVSRIMLAIKKVLARGDRVPTLVFDEIDTGISGAVAQKVGRALRDLAGHHQIISITHLPQIAAMASAHFRVQKSEENGRNVTTIERLSEAARTREVAALLSGTEISTAAIERAQELISVASRTK